VTKFVVDLLRRGRNRLVPFPSEPMILQGIKLFPDPRSLWSVVSGAYQCHFVVLLSASRLRAFAVNFCFCFSSVRNPQSAVRRPITFHVSRTTHHVSHFSFHIAALPFMKSFSCPDRASRPHLASHAPRRWFLPVAPSMAQRGLAGHTTATVLVFGSTPLFTPRRQCRAALCAASYPRRPPPSPFSAILVLGGEFLPFRA